MAGGRPSKYDEKYCKEIIDYFRNAPIYKDVDREVYDKKTECVVNIKIREPQPCPTFVEYADIIGVDVDTLKEWANVHKEFSASKKKAKEFQEKWLLNAGGLGYFKDSMAIMSLKANHKWKDRAEIDNNMSGNITVMEMVKKDGKPLKYNIGKEIKK